MRWKPVLWYIGGDPNNAAPKTAPAITGLGCFGVGEIY